MAAISHICSGAWPACLSPSCRNYFTHVLARDCCRSPTPPPASTSQGGGGGEEKKKKRKKEGKHTLRFKGDDKGSKPSEKKKSKAAADREPSPMDTGVGAGGGHRESLSVDESNALRAQLGMLAHGLIAAGVAVCILGLARSQTDEAAELPHHSDQGFFFMPVLSSLPPSHPAGLKPLR